MSWLDCSNMKLKGTSKENWGTPMGNLGMES
jgi:hypothetical protein